MIWLLPQMAAKTPQAQPVFFSLLFPQLALRFDQEEAMRESEIWEAVFL